MRYMWWPQGTTLRENGVSYHHETFRVNELYDLDHVIKFARWQHCAMVCGARFDVSIAHIEFVTGFHASFINAVTSYCALILTRLMMRLVTKSLGIDYCSETPMS